MNMVHKEYSNRGMLLEEIINQANNKYVHSGKACVFKVPTPTKVLYKNYNGYRMPIKAFYPQKSFLDYVGAVDGVPVTFDAKETNNKTSFPLNNIKEHQIRDMKLWESCKGISFLIIYFKKHNKFFLMSYKMLIKAVTEAQNGGRKSIPYKQFEAEAIQVHSQNGVYCDWLTAYSKLVLKYNR